MNIQIQGEINLAEFGIRVKRARKVKDMTQEEVGKLCGVTKASVSKWENGENLPESNTLGKLSQILNVSVDYLLCKTDDPEGKVVETVIEGAQMKLTFDDKTYKKKYPDGLTARDLLEIMKLLDKAGFQISKKVDKN